MEKNILIGLLLLIISYVYLTNSQTVSPPAKIHYSYDSICFEPSFKSSIPKFKMFEEIEYGYKVKTKGKGRELWIDKVHFSYKKGNNYFLIYSQLNSKIQAYYFNGDSSQNDVISSQKAKINIIKLKDSQVLTIQDTSYQMGDTCKITTIYHLLNDGTVKNQRNYFQRISNKKPDTLISFEQIKDSLVIYKNRKDDFFYH